ncbi:uncharacterized protein MKK02DRAFT_38621 [Dioszegia hungarica]|uniref:Post-SET domain-containing protein n=1 Tax=Dioszegia hungarica TaxID=4972 RepID=A0AA38H4B9_9TREE|nr:uncharacterized protein MKK02DRAFT_38621 [Dioszegia hungarica]KAI9633951.1 hypothetical protein MKK02DRAFT_38621 [Dioszegia hungarica]
MTKELVSLPAEPPVAWTKPTSANTKGGKLYKPTHSELFKVVFEQNEGGDEESFSSKLVALEDFPPNSDITKLTNLSRAPVKAYSSVQHGVGPNDHFELNSDLLFMNHSCAPSVYVALPPNRSSEWRVKAGPQGIQRGQDMTFFYPSTEWDMAQGFDCNCGATNCLKSIRGAKYLSLSELEERGHVNEHIREMKASQKE